MATPRRTPNRANGDGSISADKQRSTPTKKVWRVEYGPVGNRRTERVVGSRAKAADVLSQLREEAKATGLNGAVPHGGRKAWTVGTWVAYWKSNIVGARKGRHGDGLSENSLRREAWAVAEITRALGDKSLRTLKVEDVTDFLNKRAAGIGCQRRAWKHDSCKDVKNLLARALESAINLGYASAPNKAKLAGLPEHAVLAEKRDALSKADARTLYTAARKAGQVAKDNDVAGLVLALQLTTGLRPREAFTLTWGQVDMDAATLRINRTKTPGGRRTLQLSGAAMAVLTDARKAAQLSARSPRAYVFPGAVRSPHVHERQLIETLEAICEAEGVRIYPEDEDPRYPHPHEMRHTFASHLLSDGALVQRVAAIIGDTVPTVLRTYAHIIDRVQGAQDAHLVDALYGEAS